MNLRYEGGPTLQDATYTPNSPLSLLTDLGLVVLIWKGATAHLGVKNLFDRNYYYNAGFPEAGRAWFLNFRYNF